MVKNFSIFKNSKKLPNTPFPDYEISVNLGTKEQPEYVNCGGCWIKDGAKGKFFSCKLSDAYINDTKSRPGFSIVADHELGEIAKEPVLDPVSGVNVQDMPF